MTKIKKETTIDAPVADVYAAWRNFENFPSFMKNIEEVQATSDKMSHWKAKGPLGMSAEWDAEITLDEPNHAIGWRGIEGASSVINSGRVNFKEAGPSTTNLDVTIEYAAPGGPLGEIAAKIFANPDHQVEEDLARFRDCVAGGMDAGTGRFTSGIPGESSLGTGINDGLDAARTSGTTDGRTATAMGAVAENDLADAQQVADGGNVPPATSDPLRAGRGEEGRDAPAPRSDPMAQADSRQVGL